MPPAFSNALYYPAIDIKDTNWLKTAILFWDSISTIVPESLRQPYTQPDTQYLADIGFLKPLYVNSEDKSVVGIEDDIMDLIYTPEFLQSLCDPKKDSRGEIWEDKMSYGVRDNFKRFIFDGIYSEKMSWGVRHELRNIIHHLDDRGIYYLGEEFADIYMTALANKLCEDHALGMITDNVPSFDMGNIARFGNHTTIQREERFRYRYPRDHQMEQGLLLNFIINGLSISPDTTFNDIVSFKNHHRDELGRFKTQLARLTQNFAADKPINVIRQEISDLYDNEFLPAFDDFKASLTGFRIKWFTETFLKISTFATSATGVPMALLGMPLEQAVFAGLGMSVIASATSYNVEKKRFLRENPYSYLLSIKREWM